MLTMSKPVTNILLLDFKQTQRLSAIFGVAVGSNARGVLTYDESSVQTKVYHGVDLKDVATFTYVAPGQQNRPPHASLIKTYQSFNPDTPGDTYSFGLHVTWDEKGTVVLDHNGKRNILTSDKDGSHPMQAQYLRDMNLMLFEYAHLHREALELHAARAKETPPKPGARKPQLVSRLRSI